jgi:hypothetical protein
VQAGDPVLRVARHGVGAAPQAPPPPQEPPAPGAGPEAGAPIGILRLGEAEDIQRDAGLGLHGFPGAGAVPEEAPGRSGPKGSVRGAQEGAELAGRSGVEGPPPPGHPLRHARGGSRHQRRVPGGPQGGEGPDVGRGEALPLGFHMPPGAVEPDQSLRRAEPDPWTLRLLRLGEGRRVWAGEPRLAGLEAHPAPGAEGGEAAALHADPQGGPAPGIGAQRVHALAPEAPVRGEPGPATVPEAGEPIAVGPDPEHGVAGGIPREGEAGRIVQGQPRGSAGEGDPAAHPVGQAPAEAAHPAVPWGARHLDQVIDLEAEKLGLGDPGPPVPPGQPAPGAGPQQAASAAIRGHREPPGPGVLQPADGRNPPRSIPPGGSPGRGGPEDPSAVRVLHLQQVIHPGAGQSVRGVQVGPGIPVQAPDAVLVGAEPEAPALILHDAPDEERMGLRGQFEGRPAPAVEHRRPGLGGGPETSLRIEDDLLDGVVGQAVPLGVGPYGGPRDLREVPGLAPEEAGCGQGCGQEAPEQDWGGHALDYRPPRPG